MRKITVETLVLGLVGVAIHEVVPEVPLADHGGLIARLSQQLRECGLGTVERGVRVIREAVDVIVGPREDCRAARPADRIRDEAAVEAHAFLGEPVDVRGLDQLPLVAVGADGLVGVVVGIDEDDVRALGFGGEDGRAKQQQGEETGHTPFIGQSTQ